MHGINESPNLDGMLETMLEGITKTFTSTLEDFQPDTTTTTTGTTLDFSATEKAILEAVKIEERRKLAQKILVTKVGNTLYLQAERGDGSYEAIPLEFMFPLEEFIASVRHSIKKRLLEDIRGVMGDILRKESAEFRMAFYKAAIEELKEEK